MKASTTTLTAGVIVFVVTATAFVVLQVTEHPTDKLLTLAGPVVAALLITGRVDRHAADQERTLGKIEAQTNGVLDQRIREGARAALDDAGLTGDDEDISPGGTTD